MAGELRMPDQFGIDTSLDGGGDMGGEATTSFAPPGLSADSDPWLGEMLMPVATREQFGEIMKAKPIKISDPIREPPPSRGGYAAPDRNMDTRKAVVKYAKQFLGIYYKWGGNTPDGFDCSGFTKYVLNKFGVNLPRVSFQQANYGTRIPLSQASAGDLIAWDRNDRNHGADHIALYLGNNMIMEFYRTGAPSRIRRLSAKENFWAVQIRYPGEQRTVRAK